MPIEWINAARIFQRTCIEAFKPQTTHAGFTVIDRLSQELLHGEVFHLYRQLLIYSQHAVSDYSSTYICQSTIDVPAWFNVVVHRLLTLRPLGNGVDFPDVDSVFAEICRIGMLLYMAPIWRMYGAYPSYTQTLIRKLFDINKSWSGWVGWDDDHFSILLWTLSVGAFEAEEFEVNDMWEWFVQTTATLARARVGHYAGLELVTRAREMLWIPQIFDEPATRFLLEVKEALANMGG